MGSLIVDQANLLFCFKSISKGAVGGNIINVGINCFSSDIIAGVL